MSNKTKNEKERVFLTGGTGMIGLPLLKELLRLGYAVTLLTRSEKLSFEHESLKLIKGGIAEQDLISKHIQGSTYVLHLAAHSNPNDPEKENFVSTNVEGTRTVLNACLEQKSIKRIVCVSSIVVFEDSGDKIRDETWHLRSSFNRSYYAETKKEALLVTRKYAGGDNPLPIVTVFPTAVISEDDFAASAPKNMPFLQRIAWTKLGGGIPGGLVYRAGNGDTVINIALLPDVVNGIIGAMRSGHIGEEYILGGTNISKNDYLSFAAAKTGVKSLNFRIPLWIIKLASLIPGSPALLHTLSAKLNMQCNFSSMKAHNDFQYQPKLLQQDTHDEIMK